MMKQEGEPSPQEARLEADTGEMRGACPYSILRPPHGGSRKESLSKHVRMVVLHQTRAHMNRMQRGSKRR